MSPDDSRARAAIRAHPAYEQTDPPPPPSSIQRSVYARAAELSFPRLLGLIAAAGAAMSGVVATLGTAAVNVIAAVRQPDAAREALELRKKLEAVETRMNGRFGLNLEEDARRTGDDQLHEELRLIRSRIEKRLPVVTPEPGRAPAP